MGLNKSVNKVYLMGRLGKNPEKLYASNGDPIVEVDIATYRPNTETLSEKANTVDFVPIYFRGKLALEFLDEKLAEGTLIPFENTFYVKSKKTKSAGSRIQNMGKEITYIPVDFAKICLPLRDPKTKEYNKFNGRYSLKIENESFGIPFGSIPIFFLNYCCKIWNDKTRESDKISLGNSGYEFCRKIEQNTSSSMARNFENQLKRLLYAKIIYTTNKNHKLFKDDFFRLSKNYLDFFAILQILYGKFL